MCPEAKTPRRGCSWLDRQQSQCLAPCSHLACQACSTCSSYSSEVQLHSYHRCYERISESLEALPHICNTASTSSFLCFQLQLFAGSAQAIYASEMLSAFFAHLDQSSAKLPVQNPRQGECQRACHTAGQALLFSV